MKTTEKTTEKNTVYGENFNQEELKTTYEEQVSLQDHVSLQDREEIRSYEIIICHLCYFCLFFSLFFPIMNFFIAIGVGILAWVFTKKYDLSEMLKSHFKKQVSIVFSMIKVGLIGAIVIGSAAVFAPFLFVATLIVLFIITYIFLLGLSILKNWILLFRKKPA